MIWCACCGEYMPRSPLCSDLAVITLHWMSKHVARYVAMHPESRPYLELEEAL